MLGYTHAATGAFAWLVVAPTASSVFSLGLTPAELAAGTVACAGAALVPDLDHPEATVSKTFGFVSQTTSQFVNKVSGGHRHATHSILFALGMGFATWLLTLIPIIWIPLAIMFMLAAFAIRGLNLVPPRWRGDAKTATIMVEAALLVWLLNQGEITTWWWLGPAMGIGIFVHILGDGCTPERVPALWPKKTRYGYGLISHTGNAVETKIIAPAFIIATVVLIWVRFLSNVKLPFI